MINYVETTKVRMCGLVSTSFFVLVMAVADSIGQFLTWSNLLIKFSLSKNIVFENQYIATLSQRT